MGCGNCREFEERIQLYPCLCAGNDAPAWRLYHQYGVAASKAGLIALAKSIGQEMGPKGVRANAIAPGFIDTAMTQALPEEIRKEWISKIPLRRGGTVEDIANTALYLASDLSSYVSGQVIQVDGGMNM